MAELTDLQRKIRDNVEALPAIIKDVMQRVPTEIEAYVDEYMQGDPVGLDERLKLRRTPNPTDTLRVVTGRLRSSFVAGKPGFASGFEQVSGSKFAYVVGIDLDAVPYARIHELGDETRNMPKRPYVKPALDAFGREGLADVVDLLFERLTDFS